MCVYQKVRSYLEDNEIEPIRVAERLEMSLAQFSAILDGTETLYADDLRAICYALNVSPEKFIEPIENK